MVQGGIPRPSFKPPFQLSLITVYTLWTFQLAQLINYKHIHTSFSPTKPIYGSATGNPTSSGQYTNISSFQNRLIFLNTFCFFKSLLVWTIFKVFSEFVTIFLPFYVLIFFGHKAWGILSFLTRDQTCGLCFKAKS